MFSRLYRVIAYGMGSIIMIVVFVLVNEWT